ncbi:MAG TPA: glycosyltransferase family 4 protein [Tepidisphaeraceae bacterium]|nr:glycosyltransferase family 4 protein [Tepidisphaeraceae bacterium]
MRITFVLPYAGLSGGVRVVATYARRLKERGHDVGVVSTPRRPRGFRDKARSLLRGEGWSGAHNHGSHFAADIEHHVIDCWRPIVDSDVPDGDVVVATWWETAEWAWKLSPSKGTKVHFVQGYEAFGSQPTQRVDSALALPIDKITIAHWLVDLLKLKAPGTRVSLVPNSVDLTQFTAPERHKQRKPTVGMIYTPAHLKGCDIAIEAFKLASPNIPGLKLVAFGESEPDAGVFPASVSYTRKPAQDQIPGLYASCDAWLWSSRSEGFGLPILEAMACRTPVIATPAGAAPELLSNGGGVLVKPEDSQDMARAIERIARLKDPQWLELSAVAYRTATKFTWDQATDLFEAALVNARKSPANPAPSKAAV